jgi:4-hydroxythreonine-4-phosphate dehydrogenase
MEIASWFFPLMSDSTSDHILPVIGITMGDAAGIGPEVVVKALADAEIYRSVRPVVIGDLATLSQAVERCDARMEWTEFSYAGEKTPNTVEVVDLKNLPTNVAFGSVSADAGRASGVFIETAVKLVTGGEIDAICTAPINKESLNLGGFDFPGHTEFLAELSGTTRFAMSFFAGELRVVLLSTHLPLSEALKKVKKNAVADLIMFTDDALIKLLDRKVKIAVAGLNPHASENGKFGNEESDEIAPAIEECRNASVDVSGPYSPDTIFLRAHHGEFEAVIALYHDQATIPVKALSFGSAVNVTLGLPFIRTSVDHGTAFDIAGKGIADASSMQSAILLAGELARTRSNKHNSAK